MTDGYFAALAARTLGITPTLRPATPSRFENVRTDLGARATTLDQFETVEVAAPPPATARRRSPVQPTDPTDDQPLPTVALDPVAPRPATPARSADTAPPQPRDPAAVTARAPAPLAAEPADEPADEPAPHRAASTDRWQPTPISELARVLETMGQPVTEPARPVVRSADATVRAAAAEPRDARPRGLVDEPTATPPVVVHIGRIEVRAVEAPRPSNPVRVAAAPVGPSLADHLLARDRGRRR